MFRFSISFFCCCYLMKEILTKQRRCWGTYNKNRKLIYELTYIHSSAENQEHNKIKYKKNTRINFRSLSSSFPLFCVLFSSLNRFIYSDKRLCNVRRCSNDVKHHDENLDDLSWWKLQGFFLLLWKFKIFSKFLFFLNSLTKFQYFFVSSFNSCFHHYNLKRFEKSWGRF